MHVLFLFFLLKRTYCKFSFCSVEPHLFLYKRKIWEATKLELSYTNIQTDTCHTLHAVNNLSMLRIVKKKSKIFSEHTFRCNPVTNLLCWNVVLSVVVFNIKKNIWTKFKKIIVILYIFKHWNISLGNKVQKLLWYPFKRYTLLF